jgi:hypothetical protein
MKLSAYTPYARYALIILGTLLTNGGFLPVGMADTLGTDPVLVEMMAGVLCYVVTLVWYNYSKARAALTWFEA